MVNLLTPGKLPKEIVLYSSGWESTGCVFKASAKAPLVLFDYSQSYLENEKKKAERFASAFDRELIIFHSMWIRVWTRSADDPVPKITVPDRNILMLKRVKDAGARMVWVGTKNLHPWLDVHGDSNWWTLKKTAKSLGIEVKLPWTMKPKFLIRRYVEKRIAQRFVFSSEGIAP